MKVGDFQRKIYLSGCDLFSYMESTSALILMILDVGVIRQICGATPAQVAVFFAMVPTGLIQY